MKKYCYSVLSLVIVFVTGILLGYNLLSIQATVKKPDSKSYSKELEDARANIKAYSDSIGKLQYNMDSLVDVYTKNISSMRVDLDKYKKIAEENAKFRNTISKMDKRVLSLQDGTWIEQEKREYYADSLISSFIVIKYN